MSTESIIFVNSRQLKNSKQCGKIGYNLITVNICSRKKNGLVPFSDITFKKLYSRCFLKVFNYFHKTKYILTRLENIMNNQSDFLCKTWD